MSGFLADFSLYNKERRYNDRRVCPFASRNNFRTECCITEPSVKGTASPVLQLLFRKSIRHVEMVAMVERSSMRLGFMVDKVVLWQDFISVFPFNNHSVHA
jgi:hypothetical protein